jgi:hypothetical protein
VQVMRAAGAMQTAGHDKYQGIGSIVPALAKNARAGHPQFLTGSKHLQNSGPPAHPQFLKGKQTSPELRATRPNWPCSAKLGVICP